MRAKLLLPICLVVSAIVHVLLLTAVAVPRQRVTHGQIMTVDLVTPDEVPDGTQRETQTEVAPPTMGQAQEPAAQSQQTAVPSAAQQSPAQNEPPPRDVRQPASQQRTQTVQQVQPPQLQPPSQQFPQPPQQVAIPVPDPQNPSTKVGQESLAEQAERLSALLNLPGPGAGEGSGAEADTRAKLTRDEIAVFRSHLISCWKLPPGVSANQRVKVVMRVSLRPNGALASEPALIEAAVSPLGPPLVQEAMRAIRQCQPYSMLPAEKYREWRVLDIDFSPDQMSNG
jgi:hypothetical protein